ncbi:LysR substrate-binding domain-containing protein [Pseudomonas aeruginosa]
MQRQRWRQPFAEHLSEAAVGQAGGSLRQVLGEWLPPSLPLHAVYPSQRQLSPRVRVFVDWLVELFGRQAAGETR